MPYIPLEPLNITIDFSARDLDITNLNSTLAKIKSYINQMNTNVEELGNFKESVGVTLPGDGEDGDEFIVLE